MGRRVQHVLREPRSTARPTGSGCAWSCWYANHTMASGRPSGQAWEAVQHGLNEMLLSPAVKRRAGIELRPQGVDADAVAAGDDGRPVQADAEAGLIPNFAAV